MVSSLFINCSLLCSSSACRYSKSMLEFLFTKFEGEIGSFLIWSVLFWVGEKDMANSECFFYESWIKQDSPDSWMIQCLVDSTCFDSFLSIWLSCRWSFCFECFTMMENSCSYFQFQSIRIWDLDLYDLQLGFLSTL